MEIHINTREKLREAKQIRAVLTRGRGMLRSDNAIIRSTGFKCAGPSRRGWIK